MAVTEGADNPIEPQNARWVETRDPSWSLGSACKVFDSVCAMVWPTGHWGQQCVVGYNRACVRAWPAPAGPAAVAVLCSTHVYAARWPCVVGVLLYV
jgi:hypothetical protein